MLRGFKRLPLFLSILAAGIAMSLLGFTAAAQPLNALFVRSLPGDQIGGGQTLQWSSPAFSFSTFRYDASYLGIAIDEVPGMRLELAAPPGQTLGTGIYEEAAPAPFRGSSPGVSFTYNSTSCNPHGRFVVIDAAFGPSGEVLRFAADFEQWCDGDPAPLFGEIRLNSTAPLTNSSTAPDAVPDPFLLTAQAPVATGVLVESNRISIYGVNQPVPISIVGGEYSINGATFTSNQGTANQFDHVVVRATASSAAGDIVHATLNAGGQSATLAVQTYQPGTTLTGFFYRRTSADPNGGPDRRLFLTPRDRVVVTPDYMGATRIEVAGIGGAQVELLIATPGSSSLQPGLYSGSAPIADRTADQPGLEFLGPGGCRATGTFTVHEAAYAGDGTIERLAVDFVQDCSAGPVLGELRFNSAVPFSVLGNGPCSALLAANCAADLILTRSASPMPASAGKDVILTVNVGNSGPDPAYDVLMNAITDLSADLIWSSPGCARQGTSSVVRCSIPMIPAAGSVDFRIVLRKSAPGLTGATSFFATTASQELQLSDNESSLTVQVNATPPGASVLRYRLYSPVTLEHHFTTDLNEYNVLGSYADTWVQEGTVGNVLDNPGSFNGVEAVPYYRLYNSSNRWHHWTTDPNEYYTLIQYPNWNGEGVDGYILPTITAGATQLYRLTYPYIPGLHHWTIDANEYNTLIGAYGWIGEGGSGFVIQ